VSRSVETRLLVGEETLTQRLFFLPIGLQDKHTELVLNNFREVF
jgi:hypothetical protein